MKIFNIKYSILLFFVLYSLFFVAVPVFAQRDIIDQPGRAGQGAGLTPAPTCTEDMLRNLLKLKEGEKLETSKILPLCVYFEGTTAEKDCGCRNINVLVSLLVKIGNWLFGIVGAAALIVFIYGGFTILTAAGSAERVKKGKDALVAAIIGLAIVFTAQVGMRFFLKTILTPTETEKAAAPAPATLEKGLFINMPPGK